LKDLQLLKQLFRTKSLDALVHEGEDPTHQLKRALGAFDVLMLGIGANNRRKEYLLQ